MKKTKKRAPGLITCITKLVLTSIAIKTIIQIILKSIKTVFYNVYELEP